MPATDNDFIFSIFLSSTLITLNATYTFFPLFVFLVMSSHAKATLLKMSFFKLEC